MANKKFTELTDLPSPAGADILAIVDDVAGTPTTKKVTATNLMSLAPVQTSDLNGLQAEPSEGAFVNGDKTKLDGIEASADVTDATNVQAAGALMDSEVTNLAQVKAFDSSDYATSAQGGLADSATQPGDLGTAATLNVGTSANNVVQLNGSAQLPAVDGSNLTGISSAFRSTVADTSTSRTLSDSDTGKVIFMTNVADITVTLPSTLSNGFNCTLVQGGAGQVSVVAGSSVTLYGYNSFNTTAGQYAVLNIVPVASDTYAIEGDITTAPFANGFSASFDGTDDQITAAMGGLSIGSLSVWIKPSADITSSLNGDEVVVGGTTFSTTDRRPLGLGAITSYLTNEVISAVYTDGSGNTGAFGYVGSGITISSSSWNHIFMSWQTSSETNSGGAGYDFWLNGTKATGSNAASGSASGTLPQNPASMTDMYIGQRGNGSEYFDGLIDEMAIWTGDVSADVSTIYNSGATDDLEDSSVVSTAPNVWYRFGDVTGDTSSGGGSAGNGNTIDAIKNQINTSTFAATASGAAYSTDTP